MRHGYDKGHFGPVEFHSGDPKERSAHASHVESARKSPRQARVEHRGDHGEAVQALGVALVASAPIDRLSYRLQHLDCAGGSCAEMVHRGPSCPMIACQKHLWEVLNPWFESPHAGHFEALFWYLSVLGVDMKQVVCNARAISVGLGAGVWMLELRRPYYQYRR